MFVSSSRDGSEEFFSDPIGSSTLTTLLEIFWNRKGLFNEESDVYSIVVKRAELLWQERLKNLFRFLHIVDGHQPRNSHTTSGFSVVFLFDGLDMESVRFETLTADLGGVT